jgi:F-type H+-transporting ATPase subunit beta
MDNTTSLSNLGKVVSVRGSVVDIRFDEHLPPIYSVLRAGDEGRIVIDVLAQLDAHRVRGIALTPTQGLARGMAVEDTGGELVTELVSRHLVVTCYRVVSDLRLSCNPRFWPKNAL